MGIHLLAQLATQWEPPPGSHVPDDLLAAVAPRLDVVLVTRCDPDRPATQRHEVIAVDGLPAIVRPGGQVLALMSQSQWDAQPPECSWKCVAPPGGPQPLPDRGQPPPIKRYLKPPRARRGADPIDP